MKSEPTLIVPDELRAIARELEALEPLFHAACKEATPEAFEGLVASDFWEVGASGRRYSRDFALAALTERRCRPPDAAEWQTREFHVREAGEGCYLLTYTLSQPGRVTRRATLWRRSEVGGWQAVYHQGTVVLDAC